jgi:hypothetical protein
MSTAVTNEAGEYQFEPVTYGKYSLFVGGDVFGLGGSRLKSTATLLIGERVELSPDHPQAEVRFEIPERVSHEKGK